MPCGPVRHRAWNCWMRHQAKKKQQSIQKTYQKSIKNKYQKSIKNQPKIHQQYIQNLSKIDQKSVPKAILEGSWRLLGASWRGLGGLLGALGPILAPRSKKVPSTPLQPPPLGPQLEPQNPTKININQHKINQKNNMFLM